MTPILTLNPNPGQVDKDKMNEEVRNSYLGVKKKKKKVLKISEKFRFSFDW